MSFIIAIILGIVQGLTEFLPVSSSGHLVLFQKLLGFKGPTLVMDTALHVGTLIAVIVFVRTEIISIIKDLPQAGRFIIRGSFFKAWTEVTWFRILILVGIATIPAGVIGCLFKDWFESLFESASTVGGMLMITGIILLGSRLLPSPKLSLETFGILRAIIIGFAQAIAIIPGISRSGVTIVSGIACRFSKEDAARFSFLLSIPTIGGAAFLQLRKLSSLSLHEIQTILLGLAISAVVGYLSLTLLIRLLKSERFHFIGFYCLLVGGIAVAATMMT